MSETIKDSADAERTRYRPCAECGTPLVVTYLIPRRSYACAECGMPFVHHADMASFEAEAGKARSTLARMLPLGVMAAAMPFLILFAFELDMSSARLAMVCGGSFVLTMISALWMLRLSRDPAGSVASMMVIAGFSALVLYMLRAPVESSEAMVQLETRLTFTAMALIGIGAYFFSRFMRNRSALQRVGPEGKA